MTAVRLDPLQRIVGVGWGSTDYFILILNTAPFTDPSAEGIRAGVVASIKVGTGLNGYTLNALDLGPNNYSGDWNRPAGGPPINLTQNAFESVLTVTPEMRTHYESFAFWHTHELGEGGPEVYANLVIFLKRSALVQRFGNGNVDVQVNFAVPDLYSETVMKFLFNGMIIIAQRGLKSIRIGWDTLFPQPDFIDVDAGPTSPPPLPLGMTLEEAEPNPSPNSPFLFRLNMATGFISDLTTYHHTGGD